MSTERWHVPDEACWVNRAGEPIGYDECSRLMMDRNYVRVAEDQVGDAWVSTVWLGVGQIPAIGPWASSIFETMVFDGPFEDDSPQWRYTTEAEAIAGHASVVAHVRDLLLPSNRRHEMEDRIIPDDDRPLADVEPGSVDITALDKAELLAALVNATEVGGPLAQAFKEVPEIVTPMTHERAAAIIQDRLGAGRRKPFEFAFVDGRPINCDITGPRISATDAERYNEDAGAGTIARVVGELRAAYEQRRAEREQRRGEVEP